MPGRTCNASADTFEQRYRQTTRKEFGGRYRQSTVETLYSQPSICKEIAVSLEFQTPWQQQDGVGPDFPGYGHCSRGIQLGKEPACGGDHDAVLVLPRKCDDVALPAASRCEREMAPDRKSSGWVPRYPSATLVAKSFKRRHPEVCRRRCASRACRRKRGQSDTPACSRSRHAIAPSRRCTSTSSRWRTAWRSPLPAA